MTKLAISTDESLSLKEFVSHTKHPALITTYLYYIEKKYKLKPMLFIRDKIVYKSAEEAVKLLDEQGALWRETEIKIGYIQSAVDINTQKIYICPFTGKAFGDNTHPNPQDAIYEWVSKCPENKERVGGLRVKRFYISEDPELIKTYVEKYKPKSPITKVVFSSALNGKLYHSKDGVIEDFKQNYLKQVSLVDVQSSTRFQIETSFMEFIEKQLSDDKIAAFVEALSEIPELIHHVERWVLEAESE